MCEIEILEKTMPEHQVKVMLLVELKLDVGFARSISINNININKLVFELKLLMLEPWKGRQVRLQRL